jgi:hypothetical protein
MRMSLRRLLTRGDALVVPGAASLPIAVVPEQMTLGHERIALVVAVANGGQLLAGITLCSRRSWGETSSVSR